VVKAPGNKRLSHANCGGLNPIDNFVAAMIDTGGISTIIIIIIYCLPWMLFACVQNLVAFAVPYRRSSVRISHFPIDGRI